VELQSVIFKGEIASADRKIPKLTELGERRKPEHHPF
jgi:hypothetical protein